MGAKEQKFSSSAYRAKSMVSGKVQEESEAIETVLPNWSTWKRAIFLSMLAEFEKNRGMKQV